MKSARCTTDSVIPLQHFMYSDFQVKCPESINQTISSSFKAFFFFCEDPGCLFLHLQFTAAILGMHRRTVKVEWRRSMMLQFD